MNRRASSHEIWEIAKFRLFTCLEWGNLEHTAIYGLSILHTTESQTGLTWKGS